MSAITCRNSFMILPFLCVLCVLLRLNQFASRKDFTCASAIIIVISEQTEIRELTMPNLSPIQQKFILHWGEMGTRWGINRTVAQIHALLYLSPQPLHAEDIARLLSVARSNVSSSLRELQS